MSEQREEQVWGALLLGVLALATAGAWLDGEAVVAATALAVGCAAWHVTFVALGPRFGVPHAAGLIVFLLLLVDRSENYQLLIYALYPQLFLRLGWWAVPAIGAMTAATLSQLGLRDDELVTAALISTALGLGMGLAINAVDQLSRRRAETIAELEAARSEVLERGRTIGVLEERERLARELHDTVSQSLVSVVAQLEAAEQELLAGREEDGRGRLVRGRDAARAGLAEARRAVAALRPDVFDGGDGLGAGLRVLAGRLRAQDGIEASVEVRGDDGRLSAEAEDALLRCAQEALANVRRHAGAGSVEITLDVGDALVVLRVTDRGDGFDPACARGGFGLTAMRERATAAGGRAEVRSAPGAGTEVLVTVPLRPAPVAAVTA